LCMSTQRYGTARIFAFIGFLFYILAANVGVFGFLIIGVVASIASSVPTSTSGISFSIVGFILLVFGLFFIPAVVLALFAWTTIKAIDGGNYMQARTNSLLLGIVGLVFGVFIGGVFFLLAYANLGQTHPPPSPPSTQQFCVHCGSPKLPNARFCPRCGKEQPL
jgi:lysylphosphatidylglycerol synthetase-like protein (DUF2156 family)